MRDAISEDVFEHAPAQGSDQGRPRAVLHIVVFVVRLPLTRLMIYGGAMVGLGWLAFTAIPNVVGPENRPIAKIVAPCVSVLAPYLLLIPLLEPAGFRGAGLGWRHAGWQLLLGLFAGALLWLAYMGSQAAAIIAPIRTSPSLSTSQLVEGLGVLILLFVAVAIALVIGLVGVIFRLVCEAIGSWMGLLLLAGLAAYLMGPIGEPRGALDDLSLLLLITGVFVLTGSLWAPGAIVSVFLAGWIISLGSLVVIPQAPPWFAGVTLSGLVAILVIAGARGTVETPGWQRAIVRRLRRKAPAIGNVEGLAVPDESTSVAGVEAVFAPDNENEAARAAGTLVAVLLALLILALALFRGVFRIP